MEPIGPITVSSLGIPSMSNREDNDSEAHEEFSAPQGVQLDEEIQRENKARVVCEGKELRRQLAKKLTLRPSKAVKNSQDVTGTEPQQESNKTAGFLPDNIVQNACSS